MSEVSINETTTNEIPVSESILNSIKKMLGLDASYDAFDMDIIVNINAALMILTQVGVGPENGFQIFGPDAMWSDFVQGAINLDGVKAFVYLKTRMGFDPPSNSFVMDAMNRSAEELLWRLNVAVDPKSE